MSIKITTDEVIKYNRLPKDTPDLDEYIEEAQQIIDDRLGDDFDITLITEGRKRYYYNAIKKQVLVLLMEIPNSEYIWNTNARIEDQTESTEADRRDRMNMLISRINFYIERLLAEMVDDGTPTDETDEVFKMQGITIAALGDVDYYPENKRGDYNDGEN